VRKGERKLHDEESYAGAEVRATPSFDTLPASR
jgi:hypothetical protein